MRLFPLKGRGVVYLSVIAIILVGSSLLGLGSSPISENEKRSEMKMERGGFRVRQLSDLEFGTEISISVDIRDETGEGADISLYFVDEENHDEFMEWAEKENSTTAIRNLDDLNIIYMKNCSGDSDFDFTLEEDGDVYLIIVNHGEPQDLILEQKTSFGYGFGVCFVVFWILILIGALMVRAATEIEDNYLIH